MKIPCRGAAETFAAETLAARHDPPRGAAETLAAETLAARLAPLEALLQPGGAGDAEADVGVTKRRREVTAIRWSAGTNRDAPTSTSTHTVSA